ncbi:hypothetical protein Q7C36_013491 [Tachysurus vachellii]|uniref:Uncharacterized protein n=1 Tax=Tachysurus vachellii TaxID=175792 RepID=A0AA88MKS6_TACVA|nr:hypothetical protein Q7C36_013491 [Tachysurus vachellii]
MLSYLPLSDLKIRICKYSYEETTGCYNTTAHNLPVVITDSTASPYPSLLIQCQPTSWKNLHIAREVFSSDMVGQLG